MYRKPPVSDLLDPALLTTTIAAIQRSLEAGSIAGLDDRVRTLTAIAGERDLSRSERGDVTAATAAVRTALADLDAPLGRELDVLVALDDFWNALRRQGRGDGALARYEHDRVRGLAIDRTAAWERGNRMQARLAL